MVVGGSKTAVKKTPKKGHFWPFFTGEFFTCFLTFLKNGKKCCFTLLCLKGNVYIKKTLSFLLFFQNGSQNCQKNDQKNAILQKFTSFFWCFLGFWKQRQKVTTKITILTPKIPIFDILDPKIPILDISDPQNPDFRPPKWSFLTPKSRFWTPKWSKMAIFTPFLPFWTPKWPFLAKNTKLRQKWQKTVFFENFQKSKNGLTPFQEKDVFSTMFLTLFSKRTLFFFHFFDFFSKL